MEARCSIFFGCLILLSVSTTAFGSAEDSDENQSKTTDDSDKDKYVVKPINRWVHEFPNRHNPNSWNHNPNNPPSHHNRPPSHNIPPRPGNPWGRWFFPSLEPNRYSDTSRPSPRPPSSASPPSTLRHRSRGPRNPGHRGPRYDGDMQSPNRKQVPDIYVFHHHIIYDKRKRGSKPARNRYFPSSKEPRKNKRKDKGKRKEAKKLRKAMKQNEYYYKLMTEFVKNGGLAGRRTSN